MSLLAEAANGVELHDGLVVRHTDHDDDADERDGVQALSRHPEEYEPAGRRERYREHDHNRQRKRRELTSEHEEHEHDTENRNEQQLIGRATLLRVRTSHAPR